MSKLGTDASIIHFIRVLKRIGLLSNNTYQLIGQHLIFHGQEEKSTWRQMSWESFLKDG